HRQLTQSAHDHCGIVFVLGHQPRKTLGSYQKLSTDMIRDLVFSPDGAILASANNRTSVTLFDARTGEAQRTLSGHRRLVSDLAFSFDGRRLASSSWDTTVIVWEVRTGRPLVTLHGHKRSVLCGPISPDRS